MSLKNPVTTPGIDPGTVRLVAKRINHYATPGPFVILYWTQMKHHKPKILTFVMTNVIFPLYSLAPSWWREKSVCGCCKVPALLRPILRLVTCWLQVTRPGSIQCDATFAVTIILVQVYIGAWGGVVVKALRYQSYGPGIDSRWCHWIFQWRISFRPYHSPGVDSSPSNIPCWCYVLPLLTSRLGTDVHVRILGLTKSRYVLITRQQILTLSLLMSYIYHVPLS